MRTEEDIKDRREIEKPLANKPKRTDACPCKSGRKFKDCCYLKEGLSRAVSPSEAVFGFAMWLSTLRTPVVFGARQDGAKAAMAAGMFCEANGFPEPNQERTTALRLPPDDIPLERGDMVGEADVCRVDPSQAYMTGLERFTLLASNLARLGMMSDAGTMSRSQCRELVEKAKLAQANIRPVDEQNAASETKA